MKYKDTVYKSAVFPGMNVFIQILQNCRLAENFVINRHGIYVPEDRHLVEDSVTACTGFSHFRIDLCKGRLVPQAAQVFHEAAAAPPGDNILR